jgi:hypothetical protein
MLAHSLAAYYLSNKLIGAAALALIGLLLSNQ